MPWPGDTRRGDHVPGKASPGSLNSLLAFPCHNLASTVPALNSNSIPSTSFDTPFAYAISTLSFSMSLTRNIIFFRSVIHSTISADDCMTSR